LATSQAPAEGSSYFCFANIAVVEPIKTNAAK
jgi:hypothetical protein